MKKYLIGLSLVFLALASCRKIDDSSVFDKSADQRLNEKLAGYQSTLVGEPNGWKAVIYTTSGGIYSLYLKFNDSNRVQMLSNFDSVSSVTFKESSYRLKALQQPSLVFDTYSYIHVLADPDPSVNGGTAGEGLGSDFEFYFDERRSTPSTMVLTGRFNNSRLELTRATAQEAAGYASGQLASAFQLNKILTYYKRLVINGTDSADVNINTVSSVLAATDAQGNLLDASKKSSFYATLGGLTLINSVTIGTKTVTEIKDLQFNQAAGTISATINGEPAVFKPVGMPIKFDPTAAQRWKQYAIDNADIWFSVYGWHANGVDDALGLTRLAPGYGGTIYAPKEAGYLGWTAGDLAGIYHSGGSGLRTTSFNSTINAGIIRFTTQAASVGLGPALPTAVNNLVVGTGNTFRGYMMDPAGYYLVQTGPEAYDMVSAGDGLKWINWVW
jgi:hypothetical protein